MRDTIFRLISRLSILNAKILKHPNAHISKVQTQRQNTPVEVYYIHMTGNPKPWKICMMGLRVNNER